MAGVAAVSGPGVAETSRVVVTVAGMGDGVGGSLVGSEGANVGVLHPTKVAAMRRTTK